MKYFISLLFAAALTFNGAAQSKINPAGRKAIERYREQTSKTTISTQSHSDPEKVSIIVRLNDATTSDWLTNAGYNVVTDLGDMAVVSLPITEVETLAANKEVRSISFGTKRRLLMDKVRTQSGIEQAHNGIETNNGYQPFTGDGVVIGLMDGGLDPNHLNFAGRIERLWHFSTNDYTYSTTVKDYDASTIGTFTTDEAEETHATHVAGIMAGGYRGTADYMDGSTKRTGNNPYYGVAPDATLAFSVGDLYDENIIQGVENIIDYAESQGKPAAINLSLGSNTGPHDGTDDFAQALDRLGERALICVSAGNEGEDDISIEKTFTSSDKTVKTMLYYNNRIINSNYGGLDIWASDGQPLTVTIGNVNNSGTVSNATTISSATGSYGKSITNCVKQNGQGEVAVYAGVDPNNGRYNVYIDFYYALPKTGRFSISVTGKEGQTVNMYFSGYSELTNIYNPSSSSTPMSGYTAGNPDGSINGMACGKNILSVGAHVARNSWYGLGGSRASSDQTTVGRHASFASYGKDYFGRQLPLVSAPGTMLMSSFSRYYISGGYGDSYGESSTDMIASAQNGSKTDYWGPMEGTSMSCPVMTGTLGLWLQADPTLTINDVFDILEHTCTKDSYTAAAPERFGYGKVNAAEGLRYILGTAGIATVGSDSPRAMIDPMEGGYMVTVPAATSYAVRIYDMQGRLVAESQSSETSTFISTESLSSGVYLMNILSPTVNISHKITK